MTAEVPTSEERFIAPWASGEHLRKIEKEVLIPNLMKKKAKILCKDYMEGIFTYHYVCNYTVLLWLIHILLWLLIQYN